MTLFSRFLGGDAKLQAAQDSHSAHIVKGVKGEHVGKI